MVREILERYGTPCLRVQISDQGALEATLRARLEIALERPAEGGTFVKPRRSMLYMPGNSPGMLQHAPVFGADSVLLDLEDAVAVAEKDAARRLVAHFPGSRFRPRGGVGADQTVPTPLFETDLEEIIPGGPRRCDCPSARVPEMSCGRTRS
jgi:hypothetical protein